MEGPPSSSRRKVRHETRLAIALAATAGFVDAYGYIRYHVYLSFMSGNTTTAGLHFGQGDLAAAWPLAAAIFAFVAGAYFATLFVRGAPARERHSIFGWTAAALGLIAMLTTANVLPAVAAMIVIAFTMGALTTSLPLVGAQRMNITFVTGTLNRFGRHLAEATAHRPLADAQGPWDTHWRRALLLGTSWCGFILGAVLSAAASPWFGTWELLVPAAGLVILSALDSRQASS